VDKIILFPVCAKASRSGPFVISPEGVF